MNTKLTLTLEKSVIEKAKYYAKESGRSLSDLVESQLEKLIDTMEGDETAIPEEFKSLFGTVQLTSDTSDKESIRSILQEKHKS